MNKLKLDAESWQEKADEASQKVKDFEQELLEKENEIK
jgi:tropomyosin